MPSMSKITTKCKTKFLDAHLYLETKEVYELFTTDKILNVKSWVGLSKNEAMNKPFTRFAPKLFFLEQSFWVIDYVL